MTFLRKELDFDQEKKCKWFSEKRLFLRYSLDPTPGVFLVKDYED